MRPHYSLLTAPTTEPITLEEVSAHVRIDSTDDQDYLESLIAVSREYVDGVTGRVSMRSTWKVVADSWESLFGAWYSQQLAALFRTPLVSVQSVKYYAPDAGSITTMDTAEYRVITTVEPGMVQIIDDLPDVDDRPDAIQIEFTAGYASAELAPPVLNHAVKMFAAHLYEQRVPVAFASSTEVPFGLRAMLDNQRVGGWSA